MPFVTIIVPVYQVEKYIAECVESILNQTFSNWELILIDDGSKDASGYICDQYAKSDSRIRVIHQPNAGVSAARNRGLLEAQGDYILFVDADDWIEKDTLLRTVTAAKCNQQKIIQFGVSSFRNMDEVVFAAQSDYSIQIFDSLKEYNCFQYGVWGYLIHSSLCKNITFTKGVRYAEDVEFITKCISQAGSIAVMTLSPYHLRLHSDSAMASLKSYEQVADHIQVISNLFSFRNEFAHDVRLFIDTRIAKLVQSYFSFFLNNELTAESLVQVNADYRKIYPFLSSRSLKDRMLFGLARWDVRFYITILKWFAGVSSLLKNRSL